MPCLSENENVTHMKKAPLKPLEIVPAFCRLHLDFVGPLPKTTEGFRHILVIVDSTTLWGKCRRNSVHPMQENIFKIWGRAPNFGKCEKTNQTIINSLKLMCKDQSDSAQNITPVLMAYRATSHRHKSALCIVRHRNEPWYRQRPNERS